MWPLHDRLDAYLTDDSCRAEVASFSRNGQIVPTVGRSLRGDPDYEVELIFGARRLFVARQLRKPLLVEIREMSDKEAILVMDIENRERKDISPYERGLSYARWMRAGYFQSQDEIARTLRVSPSQVSRLLKLSRLPAVILNAFESPLDICEGWGLSLMEALENTDRRESTIRIARAIAARPSRPPAEDIYRELLSASANGRKLRPRSHDRVIKDGDGRPLFRLRYQQSSVALVLPLERISASCLEAVCTAMAAVLQQSDQPCSQASSP